jgi:hypothetical protein
MHWKMYVDIFRAILSILRPFCSLCANLVHIFGGNLVYLFPFWYVVPRKIWQPCFLLNRILGDQDFWGFCDLIFGLKIESCLFHVYPLLLKSMLRNKTSKYKYDAMNFTSGFDFVYEYKNISIGKDEKTSILPTYILKICFLFFFFHYK